MQSGNNNYEWAVPKDSLVTEMAANVFESEMGQSGTDMKYG